MLRQRRCLACDEFERADILASLRALHLYIEHGIVHLAHDTLATGKHRRVLIEERQPQMYVVPLWSLVTDISKEIVLLLFLIRHQIAENILLRNAHATLRRTDVDEQAVEGIVV